MKEIKTHLVKSPAFTNEMKKTHTILIPDMLPIHFAMLTDVFRSLGYNVKLLTNKGPAVAEEGLKYVHNDTCYPALLVIGQMIDALNKGDLDVDKIALMITQSGGGCRASNYIHLLKKALRKAGYPNVPVISFNLSGLEKDSNFKLSLSLIIKSIAAMCYGDLLMLLHNQTFPYESEKGASQKLVDRWTTTLSAQIIDGKATSFKAIKANMESIVLDYCKIQRVMTDKVKVGVVGEIYVKYSALANNDLEQFLASQGCEVNVPGILGFICFKTDNRIEDINLYGGSFIKKFICKKLLAILKMVEKSMLDALKLAPDYHAPSSYEELKEMVKGVIGYGSKMGEGWLLTAEMVELIKHGYSNIVCAQPFGCLPNHIVGKGMIRKLKRIYPTSNIVPIDYDPGATRVNQENRIKLMLAVARENKRISSNEPTNEA